MTCRFDVGGLSDDHEWTVEMNVTFWSEEQPCPHAYGRRSVTRNLPLGRKEEWVYWTVPRVVGTYIDESHSSICLDCLLDGVYENPGLFDFNCAKRWDIGPPLDTYEGYNQ